MLCLVLLLHIPTPNQSLISSDHNAPTWGCEVHGKIPNPKTVDILHGLDNIGVQCSGLGGFRARVWVYGFEMLKASNLT